MTSQPPSLLAARALVQTLVDGGVRHVVLAPGSRSAPLVPVLAAAEADGLLTVRVTVDERGAGFTALGMARADLASGVRRPAVVVTTSGTAVANLHPAVAEADAAGVPLLVVSADRPHELVGTGASQTTEQTRLFGAALRAVADLPADLLATTGGTGPQAGERALAGQVRRALDAARGTTTNDPGPAQVNLRLRPPLAPAGPEGLAVRPPAARPQEEPGPWGEPGPGQAGPSAHAHAAAPAAPASPVRGVVVAGDSVDRSGALARGLAEHLGWPLLAEPTSGARGGPCALPRYAELLASPQGQPLLEALEHVVVLGHPSLTRPVTALLARTDVPVDVLTSTARWTDTAGTARHVLPVPPGAPGAGAPRWAAGALGLAPAPAGWLEAWAGAVAALPEVEARRSVEPTAEAVADAVWESACADATRAGAPRLLLGASMTVRHLDRLAVPPAGPAPRPLSNRGLAGIDGTLATATGLACATGGAVRAVVGDLTFLHDAMSLGRGRHESVPDLQVVVVDTQGGDIFSTLEYPGALGPAAFSRFFSTPQAADLPALARALGATVHEPGTVEGLRALLAGPVRGLSVVHLRVPGR